MAPTGPTSLKRKIIHIDMDAFYAAVEQRDFPEYRGKPIIVGGSPNGRGVVATASYEARKFGIHSAMSSIRAIQLCPIAIFVRPRFDTYQAVSRQIREIFARYTDLIEPLSLDEAYLDVTTDKLGIGSALDIAREIKDAIKNELHLTASAGVSNNKFIAKIASDMNKPDGLTFIGPSKVEKFMERLPVEKFFGVGKVTADKMKKMGFNTGADLKKLSEKELNLKFGKAGSFYYHIVRGIDERSVKPNRDSKSLGAEDTFPKDLEDTESMLVEIGFLAQKVAERLKNKQLQGKTLTLKVKYADFTQITRSESFSKPITGYQQIMDAARKLLNSIATANMKVRLLGLSVSRFQSGNSTSRYTDPDQLELFKE